MSSNVGEAKSFAAQNNLAKNRSTDFLPGYFPTHILMCYPSDLCSLPKHTVDNWRVVLKGENPDYIHASSVHVRNCCFICVSIGRGRPRAMYSPCCVCRATRSTERSSSHRDRCAPLPETSGRWSTAGSVVWSSCYQTSLNLMR